MKKMISLLLALVMAVSLLPVSAFAAEVDVPAVQDVPTAEQQNDENTTTITTQEADTCHVTINSDTPAANAKFSGMLYSPDRTIDSEESVSWDARDNFPNFEIELKSYDSENYLFIGWEIAAGDKSCTGTSIDLAEFETVFNGIFSDIDEEYTYFDGTAAGGYFESSLPVTLTACFKSKVFISLFSKSSSISN